MSPWVYAPHSGGQKIPPVIQENLRREIVEYSCARPWYPEYQLVIRFKSQFCYIDTIEVTQEHKFPLCRLRYFKENEFSLALFMYSHERYEPSIFSNGTHQGRLIEALKLCEPFIVV